MLENLAQLAAHLHSEEIPTGDDLYVSIPEWETLVHQVAYWNIVIGSEGSPPLFWFKGRRIRQQINRE